MSIIYKNNKRKILIPIIRLLFIIGIAWLLSANTIQAATVEELLAQITDLQAKIKALQEQLAELQPPAVTYEGIPAGFSFEKNLTYGMRNNDVKYLQIILKSEVGPPTYPEKVPATGYFGLITKNSVIKFQEKYASEILSPYGLNKGTGFVGGITRVKLNQFLGRVSPPVCTPVDPSPIFLSAPADGTTNQSLTPTLFWQAPNNWGVGCPDNKKYRIQIDDNSDFASPLVDTTVSSAVNSYTVSSGLLSYNTTYFWRLRAENNKQYGQYSERSFTTSSPPTLSVSLSANPSSGNPPLNVELEVNVSGITTGPANYIFYCNRSDSGTNVIPGYNKRVDYVFSNSYTYICNYPSSGTYTAKVIVERGGLAAENRATINVTSGQCSDGTLYGQCSTVKPKYCDNGTLIEKCSTCGCPSGQQCQGNESCILPNLAVSLSANPSSGTAPLSGVDLTATVSGTTTGTINYTFYCNRSDSGTNITPGYDFKKDGTIINPYTVLDVCNYSTAGNYTAKVIVERGGLVAESRLTINVVVPFNFSLSANPSFESIVQGELATTTVTANLISGISQAVSFSASNLPPGATAVFSLTSCNPTCYSIMKIITNPTTPPGIYPITISATGGGVTKTTTYTLTVGNLSVSLSANPSSGTAPLSGVDLTATVSGTTTGTINYTFYCNRSDSGTNITPGYDFKKDGTIINPYTVLDVCNYSTAGNYTAKVIVERGTLAVESRIEISVISPGKIDLDVTYIERVPRYYRYCVNYLNGLPQLCSGTEKNKRWPDVNEAITYTAHIINKGETSSPKFSYQWLVNDKIVASGNYYSSLGPKEEAKIQYETVWPSSPEKIQFKIDPENFIVETVETNNSLTIGSHDLSISIWVEQGLYDIFNNNLNLAGSYSFEDWIEAQFAKMNERFFQAQYPVAPKGILDRVRIDKIIVANELDGPNSPIKSDPDSYLIDGKWQFTDEDPTNTKGQNGAWQNYVNSFVDKIDWGLIHELAHQLGIIDLYRMNLVNDPENNNRFQVKDINGNVIPVSQLPTYAWNQILFENPGIMAGGDTSPYKDTTYFESHTAGGMNSHYNKRRGYYGEYLFDTPTNNYLKILNSKGEPLTEAQVSLYQKDAITEYFDNTPEITGTTDSQGIIFLPNRPVYSVTTETGHTLKENPFGQISVLGTNGVMFIKVLKNNQESYHWLFIIDLNLAYWTGNKDSAIYTIKTNL